MDLPLISKYRQAGYGPSWPSISEVFHFLFWCVSEHFLHRTLPLFHYLVTKVGCASYFQPACLYLEIRGRTLTRVWTITWYIYWIVSYYIYRRRSNENHDRKIVYDKTEDQVSSFANGLDNNDGEAQNGNRHDEDIYSNETGT